MTDQRQVQRRAFLADPGDEPILTPDPIEQFEAFERFVEATGIDPGHVLVTPVVRFPLPVPTKGPDGAIRRWEGITPSMMWLPLFWLPPRLALRYQYRVIDAENGGTTDDLEIESDEVWAIRVMLELMYAGLYDPASGTWADVLSYYGLDVNNPIDQARVEMWLSGMPDDTLDAIDLSEQIEHSEDPEWALHAARDLAETIVPAQWSLSAGGMLLAIGNHLAYKGESDEERRRLIAVLGPAAENVLRSLPADESGISVSEMISALVDAAALDDTDSEQVCEDLMQILAEVADDFEPYVNAVLTASDSEEPLELPRA